MQALLTAEGAHLPEVPWNAYPRPQLVRKDWLCLNGMWNFSFRGKHASIRVPFCPESLLSGFSGEMDYGPEMVYTRSFRIPDAWKGNRILLHFGAVSRESRVFVNDRPAAQNTEGYFAFSEDITDLLRDGCNELTVRCINDLSPLHPWGKQKKDRGGMWYTPVSGIWQTVWLEPVPVQYIRSLRIQTGPDWAEITAPGMTDGTVLFEGQTFPLADGKARIHIPDPICWTPEHPHLYRFSLQSGEDSVSSYFALRTLAVETVGGIPRLCLNGKPYFFHGLLDQGYWSDGLYTPASPKGYESDILAMKALGFNTLRKHIKIEPEQFYYDCDRLGMIVFQDMVNCGEYRYLRDTLLPTLGFQRRRDRRLHPDPNMRRNFLAAMEQTVRQLGNHPSICLWTVFNEGWGQFEADQAYLRLKRLDPSRFINTTSGWFHQRESDVDSLHIYFQELHLGRENRPQLLSEFGGWCLKIPEHSYNLEKTYGYRQFSGRGEFVRDLRDLYLKQVLPLIRKGLCGAVYTQVSDVEDETNGLLTFDRKAAKLAPEDFTDVSAALAKEIQP